LLGLGYSSINNSHSSGEISGGKLIIFLDIWLQRITLHYDEKMHYDEKICKVVNKVAKNDLYVIRCNQISRNPVFGTRSNFFLILSITFNSFVSHSKW
jgi:hypothetical protein